MGAQVAVALAAAACTAAVAALVATVDASETNTSIDGAPAATVRIQTSTDFGINWGTSSSDSYSLGVAFPHGPQLSPASYIPLALRTAKGSLRGVDVRLTADVIAKPGADPATTPDAGEQASDPALRLVQSPDGSCSEATFRDIGITYILGSASTYSPLSHSQLSATPLSAIELPPATEKTAGPTVVLCGEITHTNPGVVRSPQSDDSESPVDPILQWTIAFRENERAAES